MAPAKKLSPTVRRKIAKFITRLKRYKKFKSPIARKKWLKTLTRGEKQILCSCMRTVKTNPSKYLTPKTREILRRRNWLLENPYKSQPSIESSLSQEGSGLITGTYKRFFHFKRTLCNNARFNFHIKPCEWAIHFFK